MKSTRLRLPGSDEGLGLIEIMISMMLLALLAVAVLPVLVQGLRQSSTNVVLATASQLVGKELDLVRALDANCITVSTFDDIAPPIVTDERGVSFEIHRSVGTCPAAAAYPGVVSVSVDVRRVGEPPPALARASTLVLLDQATP